MERLAYGRGPLDIGLQSPVELLLPEDPHRLGIRVRVRVRVKCEE